MESIKLNLLYILIFSYEVRSKRRAGDRNRNELEKLKYKHKKETKVNVV